MATRAKQIYALGSAASEFWHSWVEDSDSDNRKRMSRAVQPRRLFSSYLALSVDSEEELLVKLEKIKLIEKIGKEYHLSRWAANPAQLVRALLHEVAEAEFRYFLRRQVREKYCAELSPWLVNLFRDSCAALNRIASEARRKSRATDMPHIEYKVGVLEPLQEVVKNSVPSYHKDPKSNLNYTAELVLEACRLVGYMNPGNRFGLLQFRTIRFDTDYLLSNVFGFPNLRVGIRQTFWRRWDLY